ncbi:MAG: glycosyltransferase family A protein, partial [Candidatus Hodarchaeota archaeon]
NERIDGLLSSIVRQTYKNFEIIVVDNFSMDGVKEACKQFPVQFFELKSTISEARNLGLEKARGEFFIFLDFVDECSMYRCDKRV